MIFQAVHDQVAVDFMADLPKNSLASYTWPNKALVYWVSDMLPLGQWWPRGLELRQHGSQLEYIPAIPCLEMYALGVCFPVSCHLIFAQCQFFATWVNKNGR